MLRIVSGKYTVSISNYPDLEGGQDMGFARKKGAYGPLEGVNHKPLSVVEVLRAGVQSLRQRNQDKGFLSLYGVEAAHLHPATSLPQMHTGN